MPNVTQLTTDRDMKTSLWVFNPQPNIIFKILMILMPKENSTCNNQSGKG